VWVIVMENHNWSSIKSSGSAPYIQRDAAEELRARRAVLQPPGNHPSEPNYIWMEAGDNLAIKDDGEPSANHQATPDHRAQAAGGRHQLEVVPGEHARCGQVPDEQQRSVRGQAQSDVFFDDVTPPRPIASRTVRPFTELRDRSHGRDRIGLQLRDPQPV